MPERSFFIKGRQFPICSRCTGILFGFLAGISYIIIFGRLDMLWAFFLMLPLIADGLLQRLTKYVSNNIKRLITGLMFGAALICALANVHLFTVELAKRILDRLGIPY